MEPARLGLDPVELTRSLALAACFCFAWPRLAFRTSEMLLTPRFSATLALALASSSRLRAPKPRTSRLLATPSSALNKNPRSQSATRSQTGPRSPPRSSTIAPLSAATRFTRSHRTAGHSSSALGLTNFLCGSSRYAKRAMWTLPSPRSNRHHGTPKISKCGTRSSSNV